MVPQVSQYYPRYIIKGLAPQLKSDTKLTHSYFIYLASTLFLNVTGPQRDWLFSLICATVTSQANTSKGLISVVFLDGFSHCKIKLVLVAFTQAVRETEFLQGPKKRLVAVTVRYTIGYLSQAFKAYLRDNPRRDPDGSLSFFWNEYPGVKQQKEIPIIVLLKVLKFAQT